jgi:hypothetical protein
MERVEARRLQPHFISSFFNEAFKRLGGTLRERESKRFEATHIPALIRNRDRSIGTRNPVPLRYERMTFEKDLIGIAGKPLAEFVCPGHPLLDATIDLVLERHRDLLKRGSILIDDNGVGGEPRVLVYLEHSIQDARSDKNGNRRIVSKQVRFTEVSASGEVRGAGYAPYLDYRPPTEAEQAALVHLEEPAWLRNEIESRAMDYAVKRLVPAHLLEVKTRKEELADKTMAAVKERLTVEINYWDHRAGQLKQQETAGKVNAKINSAKARQTADELTARLEKRLEELQQERRVSPLPPHVMGGALIVPLSFLQTLGGDDRPALYAKDTKEIEAIAMEAVLAAERELGFTPRDVSSEKRGYDIESGNPSGQSRLRFIEVKGRIDGAETVTITKNEILTALNKPEQYILGLVQVADGQAKDIMYVREPFGREPDFGVTSVNYKLADLSAKGEPPR